MDTIIKKGKFGSDEILIGINKVADPVESTMGPRGENVSLDQEYAPAKVTNDGKTVAEYISDKEKFKNMGVKMTKEVGIKTNDEVGDFTSNSISLFRAIMKEGLTKTGLGYNGTLIKKGMTQAVNDITDELLKMAKPISGIEQIKQVASLSAEDKDYGTIIAETLEKVGKDGIVNVQESTNFGVEAEIAEGMEIEKGYSAPFMITNVARREASLKDVPVFVSDTQLNADELSELMLYINAKSLKDVLIISDGISQDGMIIAFQNKLRGAFNIYAVQATGFGENKKDLLEDIALICGTKVFSKALGADFSEDYIQQHLHEHIGNVESAIIGKSKTKIVSTSEKTKEEVKAQIERLKEQADNIDQEFELERIQERIARLAGGVAVIRVGAATQPELTQLKDKIDDAVASTKCAIAEGVVAGGGVALIRAVQNINKTKDYSKENEEFKMGYEVILKAIEAPIRAVARNAKQDEGVVVDKIKNGIDNFGFNALSLEYGDMFEMGVIEAVKGNRVALYNAYSEASTHLTVGYNMVNEKVALQNNLE